MNNQEKKNQKFFFRPGCFDKNKASIQQVQINGRPVYAFEQLSSVKTR